MSRRPLKGVRIVDLTHVWAGPLGTRILGDLGADIVKVEAPLARGPAVPPAAGLGLAVGGVAGADHWNWQSLTNKLNRAKRGLCLDLKTDAGRDTLLQLIGAADVVIENFSANAMNRLGIGYEAMKAVNASIIYVSMPGFGSTGPYSALAAFGPSVEPMTGLGAIMGYSPTEPRNSAMALVDAIGGVSAASAVVTALTRREASGSGAFLELSLHEAGVSFFGDFLVDSQLGNTQAPIGNAHPGYAPHGVYPASGDDQWLAIACPTQATWKNLQQLEPSLWTDSEALEDPDVRLQQRDLIDQRLSEWTRSFDKHELARTLQAAGIPAGPVNTAPDFMDHPHLETRGYWVNQAVAGQPPVRYPGLAIRINGEPAPHGRPAPKLGEHNREVLKEWLGKADPEIDRLIDQGTLLDRPPA